jgi:parallel beta-helix repeat protein
VRRLLIRVERRRLLPAIIAVTLCFSAVLGMLTTSSSDRTDTAARESPNDNHSIPVRALALTAHDPIYIDGDAGFAAPNASTGVTRGSGTTADPYIIEGWNISSAPSYGICIQYADVHFVIQECYVRDSNESGGAAVSVDFCSNCTVRKCTCIGNEDSRSTGLGLWTSYGIILMGSHRGSLIDNSFSNNYYGIDLYASDNITVINNNCTSSERGIYVERCENVTFAGNTASDNYVGVESVDNRDMRILDNRLTANKCYGILIYGGRGYTVTRNEIGSNQWSGVNSERVTDSIFEGCEINSNGHFGLVLSLSHNVTISRNNLSYNWQGGIYLYDSSSVTIFHNNLVGTSLAADNGGGTENSWDHGYPDGGNYWSDYKGLDKKNGSSQDLPGDDGIGDVPYYVNESLKITDRYPLISRYGEKPVEKTNPLSTAGWLAVLAALAAVIAVSIAVVRRYLRSKA